MIRTITLFAALLAFPIASIACEINVRDMNHVPHNIKPNKGEWLLVQAWTLDCAICERQKPELSYLNTEYDKLKIVNLSLDGFNNIGAIRDRVSEKQYSLTNYVMEPAAFQSVMRSCFGKDYIGTPTYLLFSPQAKIVAVRTGPFDLKALPQQLKL